MDYGWLPMAIFLVIVVGVIASVWYAKRNPPSPGLRSVDCAESEADQIFCANGGGDGARPILLCLGKRPASSAASSVP
jgi:hypothetical protein